MMYKSANQKAVFLNLHRYSMVTRATRYPVLVDPQGQALTWIASREKARTPYYGATTLSHPKLKDQLEYAMAEGMAFIVQQVENTIDPMFGKDKTPLLFYMLYKVWRLSYF